jgi:hypothetical protein
MWDAHIPEMVQAYAGDMLTILRSAKAILSKRGQIITVVGDSRYGGIKVDVAQIIIELAASIGLRCTGQREVRVMRASAQQGGAPSLGEWLLTFAAL